MSAELKGIDLTTLTPEMFKPGEILIHNKDVTKRLKELGPYIAERFKGQNLLVVGVLKGAGMVTHDLISEAEEAGLDDVTLDYLTIESYGSSTQSSGNIGLVYDLNPNTQVVGRRVLIVEDIADTNRSLAFLQTHMQSKGAASVSMFTLLEKPSRHEFPFDIDYVGFKIANIFVQGYGLDYQQYGRFKKNIIVGPFIPPGR